MRGSLRRGLFCVNMLYWFPCKVFQAEELQSVRIAIEKTAITVAMNGPEAEAKAKEESKNSQDYRLVFKVAMKRHNWIEV